MGYFANGIEGDFYAEKYCSKCSHFDGGCIVWNLHLEFNYDKNFQKILNEFIPREKSDNLQCKMFFKIMLDKVSIVL